MADVRRFLQQVSLALSRHEMHSLAALLSLRGQHMQALAETLFSMNSDLAVLCTQHLPRQDGEYVSCVLTAQGHVTRQDYAKAFEAQRQAVSSFRERLAADKDNNTRLKVLDTLVSDMRMLASKAEDAAAKQGERAEALNQALAEVTKCFAIISNDRTRDIRVSKRIGMLMVVNHLLCIAFKLSNFAFLKSTIRVVEQSLPQIEKYVPIAHRVTFAYYMGRKAMFDADYQSADRDLTFALEHCHRDSHHNKRLILIYLIPVNMLLGKLPSPELLQRHNLPQFAGIVASIKQGNPTLLSQALDEHQSFFINWGIFLILEKLTLLVYRNLFKRVHSTVQGHQISLKHFETALRVYKVADVDRDELECIVANLIFQGYIKGYMSHSHGVLVVAKQNAFPTPKRI